MPAKMYSPLGKVAGMCSHETLRRAHSDSLKAAWAVEAIPELTDTRGEIADIAQMAAFEWSLARSCPVTDGRYPAVLLSPPGLPDIF